MIEVAQPESQRLSAQHGGKAAKAIIGFHLLSEEMRRAPPCDILRRVFRGMRLTFWNKG
jgi:hypothetical protein